MFSNCGAPMGAWAWMSGSGGCGPRHHRHGHRHHGRPWWTEALGDPPPRAERGEIRYLVLEAIASQPRHGYEIIQHIEDRARGAYRPSAGVIYPTLQMLEDLGHAVLDEQSGRKVYQITDAGRADLDAHRDSVEQFYERFEPDEWDDPADDIRELMHTVRRLLGTFRRATRRGRMAPDVVRSVRDILEEALRKIESTLDARR